MSELVGNVDGAYHADPSLLYNAGNDGSITHDKALELDATLGLSQQGSYAQNWGGWQEKWILAANNQWHFITESGALYQWNGNANIAGSTVIAQLDETFYVNPELLHDAALGTTEVPIETNGAEATTAQAVSWIQNSTIIAKQTSGSSQRSFGSGTNGVLQATSHEGNDADVRQAVDAAFSEKTRTAVNYLADDNLDRHESQDDRAEDDAFDAALENLLDDVEELRVSQALG